MAREIVKTANLAPLEKNVHRYQLDKSKPKKKIVCPQCGQKTLTRFVDLLNGDYLPEHYGICDREEKCGYNCRPKASDLGDGDIFIPSTKASDIYKTAENVVPDLINPEIVLQSMGNYENNNLTSFLLNSFDIKTVYRILTRYKLGTTNDPWMKSAIFWQIDQDYNVRTGKIMDYDPKTGKRVKEKYGQDQIKNHISWVHTMEGSDYILRQCLFGEHLIIDSVDTYHLVEAEKTAVICSIIYPNRIYLATGGLQNLRVEVMQCLLDKKVIAYPDKGVGFDRWKNKIEKNLNGYNIQLSDELEKNELVGEGEDLADLIIKNLKK